MKKSIPLIFICTFYLSVQKVDAEVNYIQGYTVADCNTCNTTYEFATKAKFLARTRLWTGNYLIYNDVEGVVRTLNVTTTVFEEGIDTFVVYRATAIETTVENQQSFDAYMFEKQNNSFLTEIDVEIDRPYDSTYPNSMFGSVNQQLQSQFGALYVTRVKIGTVIRVKTSGGLTVVLIKDKTMTREMYTVAYVLDADGNVIEIPLATSSSGGSSLVGQFVLRLTSGTYYINVSGRNGIITITQIEQ